MRAHEGSRQAGQALGGGGSQRQSCRCAGLEVGQDWLEPEDPEQTPLGLDKLLPLSPDEGLSHLAESISRVLFLVFCQFCTHCTRDEAGLTQAPSRPYG